MTKSKIFLYFCISFISGMASRQILSLHQSVIPAVFISGLALISIFYADKRAVFIGICIIFSGFGIWRMDFAIFSAKNNDFARYELFGKDLEFTAVVSSEPQNYEKYSKLTIRDIEINGIKIDGGAIAAVSRYPEYKLNDELKISGKFEVPGVSDSFDYKKYLEKDNIFASIGFPKVEIIGYRNKGIQIYPAILSLKQKLREGIQKNFSVLESSILEGMILGDNNAMSNDLKSKLNITGLRHIIAISGTHVVILSSILMSFFIAIGLWRSQAFYLSLFFIIIYIALSGSPASGVRAGVMGAIFLYGQKIGRKSTAIRTIVFAGAIMLFFNPLLLFYDVGFQLSFMACFGMIYLSPIICAWLSRAKSEGLKQIISATVSAQIFTLPIIIYNFGSISFVSVITNILVLPVIYPLMVLGFLSTFLAVFFDLASWIFVLPAWLSLSYFIKIIDIFSIPQISFQLADIHWIFVFLFYFALFVFIYALKKAQRAF